MFWLRALLYLSPLALVFGGATLFLQVERLQLPGIGDSLTGSIREDVGPLNPLEPRSGVTREIRDLVFDPLLVRDDDLNLRPHLIDAWQKQSVITIRCSSEEDAGEIEAKLRAGEYLDKNEELIAVDRVGSVLTVALNGFESGMEGALIRKFAPESLGDYQLVRLTLKHSVRDSLTTFLDSSVEKGQVKMLDYEGDRTAFLFLKGDTDLFLREFQLYYESNLVLEPKIEILGNQCHTSSQELIVDLRQDVKWHDGVPVTMKDVLFSYEELTRPGSPLPMNDSFWFVESIRLLSDFQIRVTCPETPSLMMESWEKLPLLPAHLLKGKTSPESWSAYFESPVGTGPYRVVRRLADGGIVLEAVPSWCAGAPGQKSLVYRKFDSMEAKLLALRSGIIDTLVPDIRFQDWAQRNPGVVRQFRCLPRFQHFVAWNLESGLLSENEVRLALAEAVDLSVVLQDGATSYQQPVRGLFFPGSPLVAEAMPLPLYDPKSAEKRLQRLGLRYDSETGTRIDEEGKVIRFRLAVNEANEEQVRMAEALAEQWLGVGVVMEIEKLSWQEILTERLLPRQFDGVLLSWETPLGRDRYSTWHSEAIAEGGGNLFGLRNQVVDELLQTLRFESDASSLAIAASRLQEMVAELQPCFFVCESGRIIWTRERAIETARPSPDGGYQISEPGIGKAGLERVRPWWVRKEPEWKQESEETPEP
ncbi:MAG: ABC transporter substrate-binding protein [Verrucomicrobiales bacterium]|nr:ABC transporter substrate-binding protein [Verrucomicrobiales bacterium]